MPLVVAGALDERARRRRAIAEFHSPVVGRAGLILISPHRIKHGGVADQPAEHDLAARHKSFGVALLRRGARPPDQRLAELRNVTQMIFAELAELGAQLFRMEAIDRVLVGCDGVVLEPDQVFEETLDIAFITDKRDHALFSNALLFNNAAVEAKVAFGEPCCREHRPVAAVSVPWSFGAPLRRITATSRRP